MTSKQYNELELEIQQWKKVEDEEFNKAYNNILNEIESEQIMEAEAENKVENLNIEYILNFDSKYQAKHYDIDLQLLLEQ